MNSEEKVKVKNLLKDRPDLISEYLWKRSFKEVEKILGMEEWKEEKFQGLLTLNIWNSNANEIQIILEMPEWKEKNSKEC